ncbi:MAG: NAD(P)H-hydrate dehydratase [Firmicutes bacterium]|nr:NAD(P)H-hydrate dehydratase [Bacillota bacterium]
MFQDRTDIRLITRDFVHTFIRKRSRELHKGDCGRVLIIAGKKGMAGAAVLCARGAFRAGAGLVKVSISEDLFPVIQVGVPEATCISRELSYETFRDPDVIVFGPGIGTEDTNLTLLKTVFEHSAGKTVVLDADGLNLLAANPDLRNFCQGDLILTPHPGEAARLLGCTSKEIQQDRPRAVKLLAETFGATAVLKGSGTLVATSEGAAYITAKGNPGMATGGSGDVLAGVIGALAGQGLTPEQAAASGVYIHGLAGDLAAEKTGEYGLMASDIALAVGVAIKHITEDALGEVLK